MNFKSLILLPILCISCSGSNKTNTIYTSFSLVKELTGYIVGNKYEIESLTKPGMEIHDFELTAKKLGNLIDSKGLFINGLGLEGWSDSLPNEVKNKTYVINKNVTPRYINNQIDPHAWLNPLNVKSELEYISKTMIDIDEDNKEYYESNLTSYIKRLDELDDTFMEASETFTQRNIVVSHAAYGYMCDRYNLNQIYINGIDADEEPSTKTMIDIIDKVKEYDITTIFTEELISEDIAKKIASETGVKVEMLNTLENIKEGEDYFSLMTYNLNKLKEACL